MSHWDGSFEYPHHTWLYVLVEIKVSGFLLRFKDISFTKVLFIIIKEGIYSEPSIRSVKCCVFVCLICKYVPSTIFQLWRDRSSWTSTKLGLFVLLKDTTQWRLWGTKPRPLGLESSTLPLSYCGSPEHTKPLKLDCITEPHLAFAFMHKSFATMPCFYAPIICNWGFLIYTCEQQRFVFSNKPLQQKWSTVQTKHMTSIIYIFIFWVIKKNCSLGRYFWVPTTYVLAEVFKLCCKDISFIVVLFDLWYSCKRWKKL